MHNVEYLVLSYKIYPDLSVYFIVGLKANQHDNIVKALIPQADERG